jgi:hypothetical protein
MGTKNSCKFLGSKEAKKSLPKSKRKKRQTTDDKKAIT